MRAAITILYWIFLVAMSLGIGASIYDHDYGGAFFLTTMVIWYVLKGEPWQE